MKVYENIRKRRQELEMTQGELAERLGYADKSAIAKIEKGVVDLTQPKIMAFAKALNTSPITLMGWEENSNLSEADNDDAAKKVARYLSLLNAQGIDKVIEYIQDLADNDKYRKE